MENPSETTERVNIKLFVGQVPKDMDEQSLFPIFTKFGDLVDILIIRDRNTGVHKGCAFVTYLNIQSALDAIHALHDKIKLENAINPLQVRIADSVVEKENKLFIGMLPKTISEEQLHDMFVSFGDLKEVHIIRTAEGLSKGCAFVKFVDRDAAVLAIQHMHERIPEGSTRPLVVKFADSKRGDQEGDHISPTHPGAILQARNPVLGLGILPEMTLNPYQPQSFDPAFLLANNGVNSPQTLMYSPYNYGTALSPVDSSKSTLHQQPYYQLDPSLGGYSPYIFSLSPSPTSPNLAPSSSKATTTPSISSFSSSEAKPLPSISHSHTRLSPTPAQSLQPPSNQQHLGSEIDQNQQPSSASTTSAHPQSSVSYVFDPQSQQTLVHPSLASLPQMMSLLSLHSPQEGLIALSPVGNSSRAPVTADRPAIIRPPEGPTGANLFVYHLPRDLTDADLATLFAPFGNVISAKVFVDKNTADSKGFGFVSFDSVVSAERAIQSMNGFQIGNKRLKVQHKRVGGLPTPPPTMDKSVQQYYQPSSAPPQYHLQAQSQHQQLQHQPQYLSHSSHLPLQMMTMPTMSVPVSLLASSPPSPLPSTHTQQQHIYSHQQQHTQQQHIYSHQHQQHQQQQLQHVSPHHQHHPHPQALSLHHPLPLTSIHLHHPNSLPALQPVFFSPSQSPASSPNSNDN